MLQIVGRIFEYGSDEITIVQYGWFIAQKTTQIQIRSNIRLKTEISFIKCFKVDENNMQRKKIKCIFRQTSLIDKEVPSY